MIYIEEKATKKVPGLTSLFINFSYKKEIVDALKTIKCYDYDKKEKIWEVPLSYCSELLDKLCLYDDIELKLLKDKVEKDSLYRLSNYKTKPYNYQIEGIQFGLNHNKWLLLDEMGLGKSLQAIYIAQELKKRDKIKHCLIICGVNNLKANWKKEILTHTNLSCMILGEKINSKGRSVMGSIKERAAQLSKPIKEFFVITNIETLRETCIMDAFKLKKNEFDLIIVDEIHSCKSPTSQQGKHLLKLNKAKFQIGMSGTLLLNDPLDTYVPLKWIGVEKSNYTTFKYHYCTYVGEFHNILLGYKNIPLLKYQLASCSLRRKKDEVLDLPPKTIVEEYLEMDNKQATFYDNIKQGIIDEVDKVTMSTTSLLSMVARLRQATAYPGILTTEDIPSIKINRACELTDNIVNNGDKVVIFSTFKDTVYELERKLSKYNPVIGTGDLKDSEISTNINKFQEDPNCKVFIGTWQKCGTGITLTAASYMIFIDTPWTAAIFNQACDRIYRIGTKKKVIIYNLITKDTVDERVFEIISNKKAISDYIIDNEISQSTLDSLRKFILELK